MLFQMFCMYLTYLVSMTTYELGIFIIIPIL